MIEVPGAIATNVANSAKPPANQSQVKTGGKCKLSEDPAMRLLQAKIEELQQTVHSFHNKHHCHERENNKLRKENMDLRRDIHSQYQVVEKQNEELRKEIIALKRRRTDSCGSAITTASVSRSSMGSYPSSRSVERFPADYNQEDTHQSTLSHKAQEMPVELKVPEHIYSWAR